MSTATGIYFDGQVARGRAVALEFVDGAVLRVTGENLATEFDLSLIRVSDRLGDVPRFIYLPGDATIETPDNGIVDAALGERQHSRGSRLIHALESQQRIAVAACLLLLVAIAGIGFFGPPALARLIAKRVPVEVDQRIGAAALVTIRPYFKDSALRLPERSRVQKQLARLQADPAVPRPRIEFRSMNGGLPNAFALPGNVIIVTDELVRLPVADDEIAAVLAHELGHLEKRHGLQSLLRGSFAVLIVAAVTGDLSALTSFAGTIPLTILTAGYSRELEREADRYALDLLRARSIPPRAFTTALVKLEAAQATLKRNSTYLSTHPTTTERTALFGGITPAEEKVVLAEPLLIRATAAMNQHDYEAALDLLNRIVGLAPTAPALTQRARCFFTRRNYPAAEADLQRALELDPAWGEAHALRAEIRIFALEKYAEGIVDAKAALALDPRNSGAAITLGYGEVMQGDFTAATGHLNRAIEMAPADFRPLAFRGLLKERQNDVPGAFADYDAALRLNSTAQLVRFNRGRLRVRQRDFGGALSDLIAVTDPTLQTAEYFFEKGRAEQATGKREPAIADYGRALNQKPPAVLVSQIRLARSGAFLAQKEYGAALADMDAVIAFDPKEARHYVQRAFVRRRMGNPAGAADDLDRATQAGIGAQVLTRERAELNWDLERYAEAIRDFSAVLDHEPDAHAYESRGLLEFSFSGDFEKAEADLNAYLRIAKPRPQEYVEFYRLLVRRRQHANEHLSEFKLTIAVWPESWAKSVGQFLSGQITESRLLAEINTGEVPTREERACEAYYYIGVTHLIAGNPIAAEDFFQKCVRTGVINFYEYKLARAELRHGQGN